MMANSESGPSSPSLQLESTLKESLKPLLSQRRPFLHHLNADSSWLLQIPRPILDPTTNFGFGFGRNSSPGVKGRGKERRYFNIVIDPWLRGPQSDVASWFSTQWHAIESKVGSIKEVESLIRGIEDAVSDEEGEGDIEGRENGDDEGGDETQEGESCIDVVIVSHEFTDHCHKDTLLELNLGVPIFATEKAASLIKSWSHFKTIIPIPPLSSHGSAPDWTKSSQSPLPPWIGISRLQEPSDALYYHSGILITFSLSPSSPTISTTSSQGAAESVLYTPHGLPPSALSPLLAASPPISPLCLIHGLHSVSLASLQQLNLGAANAVEVMRVLKAKYWIGTHDEIKKGGGFVSWILKRVVATKEADGVDVEAKECWQRFEEVGNGESKVLV